MKKNQINRLVGQILKKATNRVIGENVNRAVKKTVNKAVKKTVNRAVENVVRQAVTGTARKSSRKAAKRVASKSILKMLGRTLVKIQKIPKKVLVSFLLICALFAAIGITSSSVGVFSSDRHLPIYSVETPDNKLSITFDCAWGAEDIPIILDTLEKENIKATFFIVGQWAEKFPDTVKLIANGGHDIANHGYAHLKMSTISKSKAKSEIDMCNQVLEKISGVKVTLFRPPYGDYNNMVVDTSNECGVYPIQWDVDSLDWKKEMSKQAIMDRILKRVKSGSIILFHNDTQYTAQLLPKVITELKAKGFGFAPVSEMIIKDNYYIDDQGRQRGK